MPSDFDTPMPAALRAMLRSLDIAAAKRAAAQPEIDSAEARVRASAEAALRAGAREHLRACGVGDKTAEAAAAPRETPALAWMQDWVRGAKPFAVLTGGYGSGKSVAAAWSLLQARRWVRMMAHPLSLEALPLPELDAKRGLWLSAARLHYADRFTEGRTVPVLDRAVSVEWLALDELREEDTKGAGRERLEEVLNERHDNRRRTVITSNLGIAALKAALGDRLASRLSESAAVFDAGGVDLRRGAR